MDTKGVLIIGAGNVGANCAHFLSEQDGVPTVYLLDIDSGRATGKALDMLEALPIRMNYSKVQAVDSLAALDTVGVVVFAIGTPSQMQGTAEEQSTLDAIKSYMPQLRGYDGVVLVDSDQDETVIQYLVEQGGLQPHKVIGVGTVPHTLAVRQQFAELLGLSASQMGMQVVGTLQQPTVLDSSCTVSGIAVSQLLSATKHDSLGSATSLAAQAIEQFMAADNRFYTHAAALLKIILSIANNTRMVLPVMVGQEIGLHTVGSDGATVGLNAV